MTTNWTASAKKQLVDFVYGEATALPTVYLCFAGHDKDLICKVASALVAQIEGLSPVQLISFLNQMGQFTSLDWYASWKTVSLTDLRNWLDHQNYFAVLAVGSAHPNGYYREMCLNELASYGGAALPYLLLRTNDWVQPIQALSLAWAEEILRKCSPEDVLAALPYLSRLERCHRRSEAASARLMEVVINRLSSAPERLTPQHIQRLDRDGRRLYYCIAQQEGLYPAEQWVALLNQEKDPFTRHMVACALLEGTEWHTRIELLLAHRDSSLRLLALQTIWQRLGTGWDGYRRFLCDPRKSIREWARFARKRQEQNFDFAAYYRKELNPLDGVGAVFGLGETGLQEDGVLIKSYLTSESARMRKAALTALGHLCGDTELETYYNCLLHGGGCAKIAFQLFLNSTMRPGCAQIFNDIQKTKEPLIKRRLCILLGRGSAWDSLPWLLQLWDDPDEAVALQIRSFLYGWQFGYQRPRPGELTRCRAALEARRNVLPHQLVRQLEFELAHA